MEKNFKPEKNQVKENQIKVEQQKSEMKEYKKKSYLGRVMTIIILISMILF